jgi:hypothetical protein
MSKRPPLLKTWSESKIQHFVECWNEGAESHALRDRFGLDNPKRFAELLRSKGYPLVERRAIR